MWIFFSILTAILYAVQGAYSKKITGKINMYTVTWAMWALSIPVLLIPAIYYGIPVIKQPFFWSAPTGLLINMVGFTLFVYAVKIAPLSITYPFLGFTPVFMIFTGYIFLGEVPSIIGIIGIVLIAAGAYVLNFDRLNQGILGPIKAIRDEKGAMVMLLVSLIWSFAATLDKVSVLASSPYSYILIFSIGFMVCYLPVLYYKSPGWVNELKTNFLSLLFLGTIGGFMLISQMTAIETAYVSYVVAIKRTGMFLALLFGVIFFGEKLSIFKIAGTLLMAFGVILIIVFG